MTPYKSWEISLPVLFFTIFAFGMIVVGNQANAGNNKVTDALDKIFATVDKGATDLQFFFGIAGRPIKGVADSVSDAVAEVQGIVDGSSWVRDDMDAIVARFQTVRNENEGRKEGVLKVSKSNHYSPPRPQSQPL